MTTETVQTTPISGQVPGTSGLRKKTREFMQPGFVENFVQSVFDATGGAAGRTYVVGGDGRFFNEDVIQIILKMASANGVKKVIVGRDGILSTPAASHLIRAHGTDGGFVLSASHNPGGIDADFGIKFNTPNGGPAAENVTREIARETTAIQEYQIAKVDDIDLSEIGTTLVRETEIAVVDPVAEYCDLMRQTFDFDKLRALFAGGFTMRFDAMHAVTGPYAKAIFEGALGAASGTVLNGVPSPDFGGGHPDPNPVWAKPLVDLMMSDDAPNFGAASDGDGDRNMIVGRGIYITPSDSLAVLVANAHLVPAYQLGLAGVARSMPTSAACDRVAEKLGIECHVTPTGWKFFGNLLDAGRATLCGEESAGTGSDHVREKDGIWAVLMWLNTIAERGLSTKEIMADHWARFGRNFYSRHDFEAIEVNVADQLMSDLRAKLGGLKGKTICGQVVSDAEEYSYHDPIDGSLSENQGIQVWFSDGGRAVLRLSGTGTDGATLRIYLEQFQPDVSDHGAETQAALEAVRSAIYEIADVERFLGRITPDVMT